MRRRVLIIGSAEFWPSYTPEVIDRMDADLWAHLALQCDERVAAREKRAREIEARRSSRPPGRRG